jgi:hypothetical protein
LHIISNSRSGPKKRDYAHFLEQDLESSSQRSKPTIILPELDQLCTRCQSIDLLEIFQRKVKIDRGSFVKDLGSSVEELKASHCVLCQLFGSISPSDLDEDGSKRSETCHLRAFSANRVYAGLDTRKMFDISDTTLLGVVRTSISEANSGRRNAYGRVGSCMEEAGYLCSGQQNRLPSILSVRLIDPESLDIKFVSDCITYCIANHRETCNAAATSPTESLQVIDCQTRTVVNTPLDCQYVALSYVWGHSLSSASSNTIQNAPKSIGDSIDLTLKLNLRYLWVDRYCIDQSNAVAKHIQIRQMDLIYARAHLTIIAAAGEDPDYGLPGLRGTLRSLQSQLKIGLHFLVSTLPSPKWAIKRSKWATRGWTYQEFLLSKRRLFFTDEQVLYECNGMHCAESLVLPLDKMHVKSKRTFAENVPGHSALDKTPGKKPWEIMGFVSEFNQRELKFPEDALNAMYGIFNSFNSGPRSVRQFSGVPILPPVVALGNGTIYKPTDRSAEESFVIGLSWLHLSPGERRQQFPSWTWAGWLGKLGYRFKIDERSVCRLDDVKVWIEEENGSLVRFPTWDRVDDFLSRPRCPPQFLHIEANTLALSIVYLHINTILANCHRRTIFLEEDVMEKDGYYAEFQVEKDSSIYFEIKLDRKLEDVDLTDAELLGKSWAGFVGISLDGSIKNRSLDTILVVQETGLYAERLGIFSSSPFGCLKRQTARWDYMLGSSVSELLSGQKWTRRTIRLA